jgi:hypothetical protein
VIVHDGVGPLTDLASPFFVGRSAKYHGRPVDTTIISQQQQLIPTHEGGGSLYLVPYSYLADSISIVVMAVLDVLPALKTGCMFASELRALGYIHGEHGRTHQETVTTSVKSFCFRI